MRPCLVDNTSLYQIVGLMFISIIGISRVTYRLQVWMGMVQMYTFTYRDCHTWLRRTFQCLMQYLVPNLETLPPKSMTGLIWETCIDMSTIDIRDT